MKRRDFLRYGIAVTATLAAVKLPKVEPRYGVLRFADSGDAESYTVVYTSDHTMTVKLKKGQALPFTQSRTATFIEVGPEDRVTARLV